MENPKKITTIGGQALMEGIMMVGPKRTVAAFCDEEGNISTEEISVPRLTKQYPLLGKPFIRGIFALADSFRMGYKALSLSADKLTEGDEEELSGLDKWLNDHLGEKITGVIMAVASVLGIALAATYNTGPVVLTGTWMIIVLAYFIRKTPFSVKTTSALLRQIEVSVEEASISLGVPPLRTFLKVVVPAMLPGVAAGAIIMWVTTLAELSSTIVLYYGPWSTMTVQVFQYIGSGDFGPASAYGAILIVSVLAPLFILNKALGKDLTTSL